MAIDTKTILELRKITGAGVNDCQQALEESGNDIEKAMEILRKKGASKVAKKAERVTKEGVIGIGVSDDKTIGVMVQLNCETDFVARNNEYIAHVDGMVKKALENIDVEKEFEETKKDLVLKIGENIILGNFKKIQGKYISSYLHANKKVGVLVEFNRSVDEEFAHDIAMHIAAANPNYVKPEDVPAEVLEKEKEIYREQLNYEKKPEAIIEKILMGKIQKYYEEACLYNQKFIKDDAIIVKKIIESKSNIHEPLEVLSFTRFQI